VAAFSAENRTSTFPENALGRVLAWLVAGACAAHAGEATDPSAAATDQFKLTAGAVLMTDYIYRGLSYSAHQPAVGTYVDAQYGWLYAWTNFNSVKFSTSPAVEVTMAAGIRPKFGPFDFDIGAAYYYYPGELGPDLSNYWEAHATVSHKLTERLTLGATLAYAPDVWQSGAWGTYAAGAISLDLPTELLPTGVGWTLSADFGRSVFGRTSSAGGVSAGGAGLPLPAYNNWRAGLTFTYNMLKLGLNYTDTTLSKENCYVMTGDLGALPGGVSTADNPTGLRSALCGATFSATLGFELNPATLGRSSASRLR
jgi:uncharacterized protein (TIGR02001 family)